MSESIVVGSGLELKPCDKNIDLLRDGFVKLRMTSEQKMRTNAMLGEFPALIASREIAQAYLVSFPDGVQHELVTLRQGGYGSMFRENGHWGGTASLHPMQTQAAFLGALTTISIASGQYFLSEINGKLEKINVSLDKILEFLYGDKKAELLAEINFTKYAYENYASIMERDGQRSATIAGLQAAKKVAIKDIEFYLADLESATNVKSSSNIADVVDNAFRIKDSLELSMQLYAMTTVLEMYFAQNYDSNYLNYIENEIHIYIDKCDKWILTDFGKLDAHIARGKDKLLGKSAAKEELSRLVAEEIEMRTNGGKSTLQNSLCAALEAPRKSAEFCITKDGAIYLKTA